jgi:hypothetical protein
VLRDDIPLVSPVHGRQAQIYTNADKVEIH